MKSLVPILTGWSANSNKNANEDTMNNLKIEYNNSIYEELTYLGCEDKQNTYLAKNTLTGQIVVKKILEASSHDIYNHLASMIHPNLAKVLDIYKYDGKCIAIEEFISGKCLEDILKERSVLSTEEACNYTYQLCCVLDFLHSHNIIHRDISPKNIIISIDGYLKLIDFDISRRKKENKSQDTTILGTVGYAAPEQFGFHQTDIRSDIYSIGVLINFMLTGHLPVEHLYMPEPFHNIITKCIQIDAQNRFQSVKKLQEQLPYKTPNNNERQQKEKYKIPANASKGLKAFRSILGFRSGYPFKMAIAIIGYLFVILFIILDFAGVKPNFTSISIKMFSYLLDVIIPLILFSNIKDLGSRAPIFKELTKGQSTVLRIGIGMVLVFSGFLINFSPT